MRGGPPGAESALGEHGVRGGDRALVRAVRHLQGLPAGVTESASAARRVDFAFRVAKNYDYPLRLNNRLVSAAKLFLTVCRRDQSKGSESDVNAGRSGCADGGADPGEAVLLEHAGTHLQELPHVRARLDGAGRRVRRGAGDLPDLRAVRFDVVLAVHDPGLDLCGQSETVVPPGSPAAPVSSRHPAGAAGGGNGPGRKAGRTRDRRRKPSDLGFEIPRLRTGRPGSGEAAGSTSARFDQLGASGVGRGDARGRQTFVLRPTR